MKLNREDWDNFCYKMMHPDKECTEKLENFLAEKKILKTDEILAALNKDKI